MKLTIKIILLSIFIVSVKAQTCNEAVVTDDPHFLKIGSFGEFKLRNTLIRSLLSLNISFFLFQLAKLAVATLIRNPTTFPNTTKHSGCIREIFARHMVWKS